MIAELIFLSFVYILYNTSKEFSKYFLAIFFLQFSFRIYLFSFPSQQGEEFRGESQQTVDELERLEQLCDLQTQEIFNLKKELLILSRKGGHILPPIEPPTSHLDQA